MLNRGLNKGTNTRTWKSIVALVLSMVMVLAVFGVRFAPTAEAAPATPGMDGYISLHTYVSSTDIENVFKVTQTISSVYQPAKKLVIFVLDGSGSMGSNSMTHEDGSSGTRWTVMVEAVQTAIDIMWGTTQGQDSIEIGWAVYDSALRQTQSPLPYSSANLSAVKSLGSLPGSTTYMDYALAWAETYFRDSTYDGYEKYCLALTDGAESGTNTGTLALQAKLRALGLKAPETWTFNNLPGYVGTPKEGKDVEFWTVRLGDTSTSSAAFLNDIAREVGSGFTDATAETAALSVASASIDTYLTSYGDTIANTSDHMFFQDCSNGTAANAAFTAFADAISKFTAPVASSTFSPYYSLYQYKTEPLFGYARSDTTKSTQPDVGTATSSGNTVIWTLGTMPVNETFTLTYYIYRASDAPEGYTSVFTDQILTGFDNDGTKLYFPNVYINKEGSVQESETSTVTTTTPVEEDTGYWMTPAYGISSGSSNQPYTASVTPAPTAVVEDTLETEQESLEIEQEELEEDTAVDEVVEPEEDELPEETEAVDFPVEPEETAQPTATPQMGDKLSLQYVFVLAGFVAIVLMGVFTFRKKSSRE